RIQPVLAEVVFPATMTIHQAKEYIYRELQELPIQTPGRSLFWQEEADKTVLKLTEMPPQQITSVALEKGVRELLGRPDSHGCNGSPGTAWATVGVEFDVAAGWNRSKAESWVQNHLGLRDLGRTARLCRAHRMRPELAAFASDLLFDGDHSLHYAASATLPPGAMLAGGSTAAVFVPVPSPSLDGSSRKAREAGPGHRPEDRGRAKGA